VWGLTGNIIQPIFNQTANIATLRLAHVDKEIAIANYERVVQIAFREVADALVAREYNVLQLESQQQLSEAEDRRYELTLKRYQRGLDSYLAVLLAQNDRYGAQQNLIQAAYIKYANLITLYKVLGGGWSCETADQAGTEQTGQIE
jgi:outer membrane protein, multidrug efflux system